jgi:uncharacterized membrane protein
MKTALAVLWQTILLVVVAWAGFIAGMTVPAVRIQRTLLQTPTHIRTYDYDWIVAVLIVYVLLLLAGAARKRLRETAISATAALVVTVGLLVLFTQIGIKDVTL